jgi:hypothetical protein
MKQVSYSVLSFGAVLLAVGGWQAPPAHAFGLSIGGFTFHVPGGGCRHCSGGGHHHHRGDSGDSDQNDNNSGKDRESRVKAPAMSDQNLLLKDIGVSAPLVGVGVKDVVEIGKAKDKDAERNWVDSVKGIIAKINAREDRDAGRRIVMATGDVTEHAIEQALETAFKNAKLDTFERFAAENWTTERLRVKVLDIVMVDLDRVLSGTNHGNVPMQQLNELIQRAAQKTYARIFELSELLASNRESSLFVQKLYQTHGNLDDQTREGVEPMIFNAANAAIAPFEVAMRQDASAYALHYRAQRIVFDCLLENVERVSSSENGMAAIGEIEYKISETAAKECSAWLERQFGTERDAVLPQKPMPLRVVWSATGPKDDPGMYIRPADQF